MSLKIGTILPILDKLRPLFCLMVMLFFLELACTSTALAFPKDGEIYFISGKPNHFAGQSVYPVILHTADIKSHTLNALKVIAYDEKYGVDFIRPYYNERFVLVSINKCLKDTCVYTVLNMDNPFDQKEVRLHCEYEWPQLYAGRLLKRNGEYWQTAGMSIFTNDPQYLTSVNLNTGDTVEKESDDVYSDAILYGYSGWRGGGRDTMSVLLDNNREIRVPKMDFVNSFETDKFYETSLPRLPDSDSFPSKTSWLLNVNNDDLLVITTNEKIADDPPKYRVVGYMLDKEMGQWHVLISMKSLGGRNFGGLWIAGQVSESWEEHERKPSPGLEARSKYSAEIVDSFDIRNKYGPYYPGTLYMYNVRTEETYYIETGQGDSEVLLINGDTVYYRVFDEIYKAKIGDEGIEEGQLLARGAVVPDIHWAFIGPKSQMPEH